MNAFYSVNQKKKQADKGYEPCVTVKTEKEVSAIAIRIRDNGVGITQKAMTKIFQPFFTTKPTGKGVGLGLSLSHDIITIGHGGTTNLESKEGEFAKFIIHLPL